MRIAIDGMHCQKCVERVRKAIEGAGAKAEHVEIGSATVEGDVARVIEAVKKAGYEARQE